MGYKTTSILTAFAISLPAASSAEMANAAEPPNWTVAGRIGNCAKLISSEYMTVAVATLSPPKECQKNRIDNEIQRLNTTISLTQVDFEEGHIPSKNIENDMDVFVDGLKIAFVQRHLAKAKARSSADGLSIAEGTGLVAGLAAYLFGSFALLQQIKNNRQPLS